MEAITPIPPESASRKLHVCGLLFVIAVIGHGRQATPQWNGRIEERDGVAHVANPAEPLWPASDAPRLRFELEQTFGSDGTPRDAMLGDPYRLAVAVDEGGNVYVLDAQASRLVAFSPDGEVLWSGGRQGGGPGEFESPRGLVVNRDGVLAVGNGRSTRLEFWSTAGAHFDTLSLVEPPVDLSGARSLHLAGFVDDATLAVYSGIWGGIGSRVYLVRIDPPALAGQFEWNQLPELDMPPSVTSQVPVRAQRGLLLTGSAAGYKFRIYDGSGRLRREVTRPVDYPVRAGFYQEGGRRGISEYGSLSPPLLLPQGYLLLSARWAVGIDDPDAAALADARSFRERRRPVQRETRASFDLFDESGRFLYSLPQGAGAPDVGSLELFGPDGKLYTTADDPYPQVRRYRVEVDAPAG